MSSGFCVGVILLSLLCFGPQAKALSYRSDGSGGLQPYFPHKGNVIQSGIVSSRGINVGSAQQAKPIYQTKPQQPSYQQPRPQQPSYQQPRPLQRPQQPNQQPRPLQQQPRPQPTSSLGPSSKFQQPSPLQLPARPQQPSPCSRSPSSRATSNPGPCSRSPSSRATSSPGPSSRATSSPGPSSPGPSSPGPSSPGPSSPATVQVKAKLACGMQFLVVLTQWMPCQEVLDPFPWSQEVELGVGAKR
ncbi:hypothetical protein JOB18_026408 [Solea senegalensis]|uniref:Uncharacterized protein n=1 Tax=Solea senegalensis TaxID=28829 RepID=A0AAV6PL76_SOLSE|nr:hypothetical protein JOB18_026408 [Solea senegalensis]